MNMNLLLHQEIKSLRAQNERKIKGARRNATPGTDTILSVQEGRNRLQQVVTQVDTQVEESIHRPRKRAPQRCSGCNIIGHTVRSCLVNSYILYYFIVKFDGVGGLKGSKEVVVAAGIHRSVMDYVKGSLINY